MDFFSKLMTLFTAVMIPIAVLNLFGSIVSGVWLAFLGEWGLIGYGIVGLLGAGFLLAIALMPGMLLAAPAVVLAEKGNPLGVFFIFLSSLYNFAVFSAWCIGVLIFFWSRADNINFIPLLIWSYSVALGPINWLAHKDGDNLSTAVSVMLLEIAFIVTVVKIIVGGITLGSVLWVFGISACIGVLLQAYIGLVMDRYGYEL